MGIERGCGCNADVLRDRPNGMAVYESREVFYGPGAKLLEAVMAKSLQQGFDSQGAGLKLYLEKK